MKNHPIRSIRTATVLWRELRQDVLSDSAAAVVNTIALVESVSVTLELTDSKAELDSGGGEISDPFCPVVAEGVNVILEDSDEAVDETVDDAASKIVLDELILIRSSG